MDTLEALRRRTSRTFNITLICLLTLIFLAACADDPNAPVAGLVPSEEERILNIVEDYYLSDLYAQNEGNIPEYEAVVQAVDGQWARVAISPIGVESAEGPDLIYLQNSADLVLTPTAEPASSSAANVERADVIGWTIVAGPQARFTDAELDAAGVPEEIRP